MKSLWQGPVLSVMILALGATSAFPSPEGPLTYQYRICSRVVDLLYDLSGDKEADRRELVLNLSGDPAWRGAVFEQRISPLLTRYNKPAAKAALRAGVIDNVLEVYLATDRSARECAASGCTASLTYDNGSQFFTHDQTIEIDGNSIIYAFIGNNGSDLTTPLGLTLFGSPKVVTVLGRLEELSIFQTGVFIPCPAPDANSPRCEDNLGNLPQDKSFTHDNFQTVMTERSRQSPDTCVRIYEKLPLSDPH